jgi:phosphonopyruvate decarboxylase
MSDEFYDFKITPEMFFNDLISKGFGPFFWVPCSILAPLIEYAIYHKIDHFCCNNEGEAVAIASGYVLSGKHPVVMLQNSGIGNAVNPITSLLKIFNISLLFVITLRGEKGVRDEPQHTFMGSITQRLLVNIGVENEIVCNLRGYNIAIEHASKFIYERNISYGIILRSTTIRKNQNYYGYKQKKETTIDGFLTRKTAIKLFDSILPKEKLIVSTTGFISRELFECHDSDSNFYMVGSMGCASSIGLGVALSNKNTTLIVIYDGDGALLMRLENLVSIGHYSPSNLLHIVFDNNMYESTGGQSTLSSTVDIAKVALSVGYKFAYDVRTENELILYMKEIMQSEGPFLLRLFIHCDKNIVENLPKRISIIPEENKKKFMRCLENNERYIK